MASISAPRFICCFLNSLSKVDPGLLKLPTAGLPKVRFSETGDIGLLLIGLLARLSHESEDTSLTLPIPLEAAADLSNLSGRFSLSENIIRLKSSNNTLIKC